jgi:hypothetical protein
VRVILLLKEDERDQVVILNSIVAQAKEAIEKMVPPKSKLLFIIRKGVLLETNCFGRQSQLSDIKLKRFPQGNLAHRQSVRSKGDDSKFLNGGRCHVFDKRKVNNLKLSSMLT